MALRSVSQRRGAQRAALIIAPSQRFAHLLTADYVLPPSRIRVVPNPIDLDRFSLRPRSNMERPRVLRLLYVSRIAVRKGVEMVVELTHRLSDLEGVVEIEIVGAQSLWSDYRHLLAGINDRVASYSGHVRGSRINEVMHSADIFLCPSRYEPFGLTAGEALASGVPVVASDAVGAVEEVSGDAAESFRSGDPVAFECAVRAMVARVQAEPAKLRSHARREAERLFSRDAVSERMRLALTQTSKER
jgi:glycosyltransferase involved in cell wall biosynthesis